MNNSFIDVALRGKQFTVNNSTLIAKDISTNGYFPKAWLRREDGFFLLKDGGKNYVENEILASKICQCFNCNQVKYEEYNFEGQVVSISQIMTSLDYSIASYQEYYIYAMNKNIDPLLGILKLDKYGYYMMNILDYLVGNTDRHWENWGVLVDTKTNKPIRLYDLMDFNQAFCSYDTIDGSNSLIERSKTQKQTAIEAVKAIGLNQIKTIDKTMFVGKEQLFDMFEQRLNILKEAESL